MSNLLKKNSNMVEKSSHLQEIVEQEFKIMLVKYDGRIMALNTPDSKPALQG